MVGSHPLGAQPLNLISLLTEAAESELGLEIKSPEAQRLRENLHRQIELLAEPYRTEFHGAFLISQTSTPEKLHGEVPKYHGAV